MLQLVIEKSGNTQLHIIHCPPNLFLHQVLHMYLTRIVSENLDHYRFSLFGRDKMRLYTYDQLPQLRMSELNHS
jgi:hypothetical protein